MLSNIQRSMLKLFLRCPCRNCFFSSFLFSPSLSTILVVDWQIEETKKEGKETSFSRVNCDRWILSLFNCPCILSRTTLVTSSHHLQMCYSTLFTRFCFLGAPTYLLGPKRQRCTRRRIKEMKSHPSKARTLMSPRASTYCLSLLFSFSHLSRVQ